MKIVAISTRKKGLTLVTLEDGSENLIDTELVLSRGLSVNGQVENIDELLFDSDLKRAKSRAIWYLSRRDYSKKELTDKLITAGFSKKTSALAVERMEELGLVNDEAFAKRLFTELVTYRHASTREAVQKLKLKGIDRDLIKALEEENESDESESIKLLIAKKYQNRLDTEDGVKKVFAALIRKGFSPSDVRRALKEYSEELECEDF